MNTMTATTAASTQETASSQTPILATSETPAGLHTAALAATTPPPSTTPGTIVMNAKIAITFLTKSPDKTLVTLGARIIESMTGNAAYPAPFPTLAVVVAAQASYASAVNGLDRGTDSIALRNKTRAALAQVLRNLALYVQYASGGDKVTLLSSGFPVQAPKKRGTVGLLGIPQNVRLRRTRNSTQLVALCKAMTSASSYQWRYANAATPTVWTQPDPATAARYTLENVVPGTSYIVQVRAFGTSGPSDWSDSATLMAA
jgi:hypothetical protein